MLKYAKVGYGVGVGVVDLVADIVDQKQGYSANFQNIHDITRAAATIGGFGYAAISNSRMAEHAQEIAQTYTPLFIRSVYNFVQKTQLAGHSGPAGFRQVAHGQGYGAGIPPALAPSVPSPAKGYRTFQPV